MTMLVLDPADQARILAQRRESGGDRFDEVWDGDYVMSPLANNEHQILVNLFCYCFSTLVVGPGLGIVQPGANVSDRAEGWERNYRCPDVVVYLHTNPAIDHGTHWLGGPDLAVEVVSRYDRSREKFDFYAQVSTREVLIVDRYPWALELYRLNEAAAYDLVGRSTPERPDVLASAVLPLTFRLEAGSDRPRIRVIHADGAPSWLA